MITIGGGEILDACPAKHRRSDRSVIEKLTVFKDREPDKALMTVIEASGLGGIGVCAWRHGAACFLHAFVPGSWI